MNYAMQAALAKLSKLLEADELTAGMYVRVYGNHLIAGPNRRCRTRSSSREIRSCSIYPFKRQLLCSQCEAPYRELGEDSVLGNARRNVNCGMRGNAASYCALG